jgi:LmbE family N-acetylglucosaminyl deacetylase
MSLLSKVLKIALPPPKILDCEKFLFIGPHPDDIEIGAGATVLKLTSLGKKVKFLICTDGRYGTDDLSLDDEKLIAIRQDEAKKAAEHLGVNDVEFFPYPDGGNYDRYELTKSIAKVICNFRPDIIFAPDPKLTTELHIDHINVGEAASNAFIMSGIAKMAAELGAESISLKGIAYYFTNRPNQYIKTSNLIKKQFEAIKLFESQFPNTEEWQENLRGLMLYIKLRAARFGMKRLCKSADGFCVLGTLHVHCAPESENF